jgi:opacity protein-like surface antigen
MSYIVPTLFSGSGVFTPLTGATVTIPSTYYHYNAVVTPASSLAALTISLPASAPDGTYVTIIFNQPVAALTWSGAAFTGMPASAAVGAQVNMYWSTSAAPMGIYVGAHAGSNLRTNSDYSVGGSVGYQFTPNYAVEVTYDYNAMSQSHTVLTRGKSHTVQTNGNGQAAMLNGVYSRRIGTSVFTPYVLAGAGMGWNNLGVTGTQSNATLYNVGAGLRVNWTSGVDFDARYRYIAPMDNSNGYANGYTQHVVTGGLRLNF